MPAPTVVGRNDCSLDETDAIIKNCFGVVFFLGGARLSFNPYPLKFLAKAWFFL